MGKKFLNIMNTLGNIVTFIIGLPTIIIIGPIFILFWYLFAKTFGDVDLNGCEDLDEQVRLANGRGNFSKGQRLDHYKVHKYEHLDHLVYDNDTENWYNSLKKEQ